MTVARQRFTDIANQVMITGKRMFITKNNKPAFAVVPIYEAEILQALEDKIDLAEALAALEDTDSTSLESLKKKLNL
jgi:prevent-host-death family protein